MKQLLWLVPLLPLLGAAVNGVGTFRPGWSKKAASITGILGAGLPMAVAFLVLADWWDERAGAPFVLTLWEWVLGGNWTTWQGTPAAFNVTLNLQLDALSALMLSFVTFIGFLIHVYSTGYMHEEPRGAYARYFAYLNLFMFSMLTLVLGGNFLVTFVGWEGVGLCSYLLIGFYYDRNYAADAGKKAFVMNRIGDFGVVLGIFLVFMTFGTLNYAEVIPAATANPEPLSRLLHFGFWGGGTFWTVTVATAIGLCLFLGACGKSAQIPLYVWLPDAMAGPTPVSALIHAATMVTAGVYMVTRANVFFRLSNLFWMEGLDQGILHRLTHDASFTVAVVGAATAFLAATIGLVQNDIKKVLAYSTVSQLGFMFLGCGTGAYVWGMFHVFTHAFFKACLFLGSGSVIHGMGGEQDISKMGGLRAFMPVTWKTMLVSTWAIAGFPWAAGFYSKDPILGAAFLGHHPVLFTVGFLTAGMTAFYMYRMMYTTFSGSLRSAPAAGHGPAPAHGHDDHGAAHGSGDHGHAGTPHESPKVMTVPLVILAAGALLAGVVLGFPAPLAHLLGAHHWVPPIQSFLAPILPEIHGYAVEPHHAPISLEMILMGASVAVALLGWFLARLLYSDTDFAAADALAARFPRLHALAVAKWKVDELYEATVIRGTKGLGNFLAEFDLRVVDGMVNGTRHLTVGLSSLSAIFDLGVVDGLVNGVATVLQAWQRSLARFQSGLVQRYALVLGFGLFGLMCLYLFL